MNPGKILLTKCLKTRSSSLEGRLLITYVLLTELMKLAFSYHLRHVEVQLSIGTLRGSRRHENYDIGTGALTDTVDQYLGVIYAEPPVGSLRFKPPRPAMPWAGIQYCTEPGWVCPQKDYYNQTSPDKQSEDCLNLNIYSPVILEKERESREMYPVMVYIHGGSYEEGAAIRYDGFCLATHGVVVVTINYRLGPLGFLSNGGPELPGNYGILDQIEALRWINTHIHHFRGDPNNVTLFGNSAGASSVGLLLVSPKSQGLFHGAIIQSGPPLSFWAVYNHTVDHAQFTRQVALRVGCQNENMSAIVDCLQRIPYSTFIEQHIHYPRIVPSRLNFKPVIDGDVLPEDPEQALMSGLHHPDVPVMIGVMSEEWTRSMGWFFMEIKKNPDIDDYFSDGIDRYTFEKIVEHVIIKRFWWPPYVADVLKHAYTNWTNISHPIQNRVNYVNLMSDLIMVAPSVKTAKLLASHRTPVYMYQFDHKSIHADKWFGSFHSLELNYMFGSAFTGYDIAADNYTIPTTEDKVLSRKILKMWSSFARNRNPTLTSRGETWQKFDPIRTNYFYITASSSENLNHLRADKMALWNDLIPKLLPVKNARIAGSKLGISTNWINYQTLSWVLLASCVLFLTALVLVSWRLMAIRNKLSNRDADRHCRNGAPPQMV